MTDHDYIKYFELKDRCRNELIHFLLKALSVIPKINNPRMLDIGCGTGIPTIALSNYFAGHVLAIDTDTNVLSYLKKKIKTQKLSEKVEVTNSSLFDIVYKNESYDIILAEGVLNIVGFKKGLSALLKLAKKATFLVIHDENRDLPEKHKLFNQNNFNLVESFFLSEEIWWNNYYKYLEQEINQISDKNLLRLFEPDLTEIQKFKTKPSIFRSVYFVVRRSDG